MAKPKFKMIGKRRVRVYTPEAFELAIDQFADEIGLAMEIVITKVSIQIHDEIVAATPVDTGRARASWNYTVDRVDPTVKPDGKFGPDDAKKGREGEAAKIGADSTVFISNNLPYILPLEYGHSQQAPKGMARTTFSRFSKYFNDTVRKEIPRR